ncbi:MAG: FecR domain-containing protein [Myxococcales bacterium]|nr:FecR domain-containing protein [Myxococcales bacterium]
MGLTERQLEEIGRRASDALEIAHLRGTRQDVDARLAAIHRREGRALGGRGASRRRSLLLAAAAAILLLAAFVLRPRDGAVLTYRVEGEQVDVGHWVGSDERETTLAFSDGSTVVVRAASRARVTDLTPSGATVLLERGALRARVVHGGATHWRLSGGPFEVHVLGTELDLAYDSTTEALSVAMVSGVVRVEGPCIAPGTRFVSAPERLTLSCRGEAPEQAAAGPTPVQPSSVALAEPVQSAQAAAPAPPKRAPSWRALIQARQVKDAFEAAETAGLDHVVDVASGAELIELGSGARLAGHPELATELYEATRSRFPRSEWSAAAAYHLGRMAFDGRRAWAEAERWFGVYLAERPSGALAPEALGRSMECAQSRGDTSAAQGLAMRYLAAYPNGAHAALAREILGGSQPE